MSEISHNRSLDIWALPGRTKRQKKSTALRSNSRIKLRSAELFSLEELVQAYNQTRVDYIVPMPMNLDRLNEYINRYDIDLSASWVALHQKTICGLGMLGIRQERAWITRVGVLPSGRRQGTGRALINKLIRSAYDRGLNTIWLEVIKDNFPAEQLFLTSGFRRTRELIVARRPPNLDGHSTNGKSGATVDCHVTDLSQQAINNLLDKRKNRPNWLVESESFCKSANLQALYAECDDGGKGWVVYEASALQLKHVVVEILAGDPTIVTRTILEALHARYPHQDATMENLPISDPTWRGYEAAGYFDVFRRIEMVKNGVTA